MKVKQEPVSLNVFRMDEDDSLRGFSQEMLMTYIAI